MQSSASLKIESGSLSGGGVTAGAAAVAAYNGDAYGSGIFLQGDQNLSFAPAAGTTETLFDVIADHAGSGGTGASAGAGGLIMDAPGTLALDAQNTFSDGVTLDSGTLEIGANGSTGTGAITFAGPAARLQIDAAPVNGSTFANTLSGFTLGDQLDLLDLTTDVTAAAYVHGAVLSVESDGD